jgi:hypothetical protein
VDTGFWVGTGAGTAVGSRFGCSVGRSVSAGGIVGIKTGAVVGDPGETVGLGKGLRVGCAGVNAG